MIKINLLGDALAQAAKRTDRAEPAQVYGEGEGGRRTALPIAGIVVGLLCASGGGIYYAYLNNQQEKKEARQAQLKKELDDLRPFIELEKKFREQKEALQKKEEVMMGLKKNQQLPVHFFEELANSLPEDVWFAELSWKGTAVNIKGEARTFEAAKQFYDNLKERPRWFTGINYPGGTRDNAKGGGKVTFTMSLTLQNPA